MCMIDCWKNTMERVPLPPKKGVEEKPGFLEGLEEVVVFLWGGRERLFEASSRLVLHDCSTLKKLSIRSDAWCIILLTKKGCETCPAAWLSVGIHAGYW